MFAELQALYDAAIAATSISSTTTSSATSKHVRPMMPKLKEWLQKHDYPFEFSTEASINLADDDEHAAGDEAMRISSASSSASRARIPRR